LEECNYHSHNGAAPPKRLFTDGNACPGVEIRLADDGEILSRGPDLCLGYTDQGLTERAFDDEGWYRTGDIGVLDEDGYLTITDRKSDIIIRGGERRGGREAAARHARRRGGGGRGRPGRPARRARCGRPATAAGAPGARARRDPGPPGAGGAGPAEVAGGGARGGGLPAYPSGKVQKVLLRRHIAAHQIAAHQNGE
jgi:acyl-CoA synthetase